jgi:hypothetical protein
MVGEGHPSEAHESDCWLTLDTSGNFGAGEGARTLDPDLGKVVLYH